MIERCVSPGGKKKIFLRMNIEMMDGFLKPCKVKARKEDLQFIEKTGVNPELNVCLEASSNVPILNTTECAHNPPAPYTVHAVRGNREEMSQSKQNSIVKTNQE